MKKQPTPDRPAASTCPALTPASWPAAAAAAATAAGSAALALASLLMAASASADPMRPLAPTAAAVAGGTTGAASAPSASATAAAAPALPRLVAIRQGSDGRRQALIGERWVMQGESVAGHTLVALADNHVDLAQGRQRQRVHLLPPLQASVGKGSGSGAGRGHPAPEGLAQALRMPPRAEGAPTP